MKLRNKLLPLTGIAAITSTVAPLALTSCGSTSDDYIDLVKWYTPTIYKHATCSMTQEQAMEAYFCKEDTTWSEQEWLDDDEMTERITQDVLFGKAVEVQATDYYVGEGSLVFSPITYNFDKYEVKYSNVKVGHMTNYYDIDPENAVVVPTLSFVADYKIDRTIKYNVSHIGGSSESYSTSTEGTLTVINVPIKLGYEYDSYLDTYAWHMFYDLNTLAETEATTRIPFSIRDEYTSWTTYTNDEGSAEDVKSQDSYEYYSNMPWYKIALRALINDWDISETEAIKQLEEGWDKAAGAAYDAALEAGYEKEEASLIAIRAGNKYYVQQGFNETLENVNFYPVSYYLFSVSEK